MHEFTRQLALRGQDHNFHFLFYKFDQFDEPVLCMVKSGALDFPIVMGKNTDGSWSCVSGAPVVIAEITDEIVRSIIDYKAMKAC